MPVKSSRRSSYNAAEDFIGFYDEWIRRQERYLDELQRCIKHHSGGDEEGVQKGLIDQVLHCILYMIKVLSHYQEYYEHKSKTTKEDVFLVFSPPWLTPFEKTLLWVAGFKPSLAFPLLAATVTDLSPDQAAALAALKVATVREEKELVDDLGMVQERVGSPPLTELARRAAQGQLGDGDVDEFAEAMVALKEAMGVVVKRGDQLRTTTVTRVLEILGPIQTMRFFVGVARYQLGIRSWGLQTDSQR